MENTHEFVKRIQEQQKKEEKNKESGKGHPERQLPNKRH